MTIESEKFHHNSLVTKKRRKLSSKRPFDTSLRDWDFFKKLGHFKLNCDICPLSFPWINFLKKKNISRVKRVYCSHSLEVLNFRPFERNKKLSTDQLSASTVSHDENMAHSVDQFSSKTFNLCVLHHKIVYDIRQFHERSWNIRFIWRLVTFFSGFHRPRDRAIFSDAICSTVSVSPGNSVTWRT